MCKIIFDVIENILKNVSKRGKKKIQEEKNPDVIKVLC